MSENNWPNTTSVHDSHDSSSGVIMSLPILSEGYEVTRFSW